MVPTETAASGSYEYSLVEASVVPLLPACNAEFEGLSRGKRMCLVSFVAKEARPHGISFEDNIATRAGWGVRPEASPARPEEAGDHYNASDYLCELNPLGGIFSYA